MRVSENLNGAPVNNANVYLSSASGLSMQNEHERERERVCVSVSRAVVHAAP